MENAADQHVTTLTTTNNTSPSAYAPPSSNLYPSAGYTTPAPGAAPGQPQVVVISAGQQPVIVHHVQWYAGHIIFSCFVLWWCSPLFGLIAFILAGWYSMFNKCSREMITKVINANALRYHICTISFLCYNSYVQ